MAQTWYKSSYPQLGVISPVIIMSDANIRAAQCLVYLHQRRRQGSPAIKNKKERKEKGEKEREKTRKRKKEKKKEINDFYGIDAI